MKALRRLGCRPISGTPSPSRVLKESGFALLDPAIKLEEEKMPAYDKSLYYPVRFGEVFNNRYQVLSKLGFGANSTVWFCRDLQEHQYTALKVYIHHTRSQIEARVLKHIASKRSHHLGRSKIRNILDSFDINGPLGHQHQCLIHKPLLMSLQHLQFSFKHHSLSEDMLKILLQELFVALDYLHTETQVIHTDIQSKNIMVGTTDPSVFMEWDTLEQTEPSPRKVIGDRIVYKSRTFQWKDDFVAFGLPLLSDFGEARIGSGEHEGLIQPNQYRAPEVLLGMKWTSKVDIWNIGVMIWSLFEDHLLFDGAGPDGGFSDAYLLAEMISVLGPPPIKFLERSEHSWRYWTKDGAWRGLPPIPENSLEDSEERLEGKNKELFMQFLRKMLTWMPEERFSAKELLQDEWLMRPRHNVNRPP